MVKTALLDLNVLLALAWPSHEHHEAAHAWLRRRGRGAVWATCSLTQFGFVRLSSNPRIVDPVASPEQASEVVRRMIAHAGHVFWVDDLDAGRTENWLPPWVRGHRQVTDAHLVRLAARHRGRVATFDAGLLDAAGDAVELIPAGRP